MVNLTRTYGWLHVSLSRRTLIGVLLVLIAGPPRGSFAATTQKRYYAHQAVHDRHGVIAPWYKQQNGPCDFRVRIAAETCKRYPWTTIETAAATAPHFVFNGHWKIAADGTITPVPISDWNNGDLGQRAAYVLAGLVDYYRYTGDPAAIALISLQAEALLDHCLTPADHAWPRFLVSVPIKGKPYGQCDPRGMIQLDIVAEVGLALLKSYQVTGNTRWFDACKHWGDLMAAKRNRRPGSAPWGRYANPESAPWKDNKMTGGVVFLLDFFDELIRLGYTGDEGQIVKARDAGRAYLRDVLLPNWTVNDVWGRNYWDWPDPVQAENVTDFAARYLMDNKIVFPNWRNDTRNILSLFLNHTSVCSKSAGDVYSGAWAFPESSSCCGRSLWYGPMELAVPFAQYGAQAQSPWGRELARRMQILATYDGHETGVSEDNIDGGFIVNGGWFKIAHPMALKHLLGTMAWMPAEFGAARENHVMRSTAVVNRVVYAKGRIQYATFDAPKETIDVLRLAFTPKQIRADGQPLTARADLTANGYATTPLADGDYLVTIRHDGANSVVVEGDDPQSECDDARLVYTGTWTADPHQADFGGSCRVAGEKGATAQLTFTGNQVRLIGRVDPGGGLADVILDGVKQLVRIDCWCPASRHEQVLYYRNGLANGPHTLQVVVRGQGNPRSAGTSVYVDAAQWSAATGTAGYGEGGGPTDTQRMVLGFGGREDIKDSAGKSWRPCTEFTVRLGAKADSVEQSWWTVPTEGPIAGTSDPDLYRYGVHAHEFCVNVTVGPGTYYVRLKFAAGRRLDTCANCTTIAINGREVVHRMDIAATAGGPDRAFDLVFNKITPRNGVIDIRFTGGDVERGIIGEASCQALEVGPGSSRGGVTPVTVAARNLLRNAGFEQWESAAATASGASQWRYAVDAGCPMTLSRAAVPPGNTGRNVEVAEGDYAARIAGKGHSRLCQEVAVRPNSVYRASVFVRAWSARGKAFGNGSNDSAGLLLEELDAGGNVVSQHPNTTVVQAGPYRYVASQVTTRKNTSRLRFVLDTTLTSEASAGSVSYDQCVLDGPPAPAVVIGRVTDEAKSPIENAVIAIGSQAVRTDSDGGFTVAGLSDLRDVSVRADKQGHYALSRVLRLHAGENRCDFALIAFPTSNLLTNGGFEKGFAAARSVEHGADGTRGPWTFSFSPGTACYIYPESIYKWRKPRVLRGKEAISQVSDGGGQIQLHQDVVVDPNVTLTASVWVQGLDVQRDGHGFGASDRDFAGLEIQERDVQGHILVSHEKVGIHEATQDFQRINCRFTTNPGTASVRFILLSRVDCGWQQGAAIFDDCVLEQAATGKQERRGQEEDHHAKAPRRKGKTKKKMA